MPVDTLRAVFSYLIALTVVIGGGAYIFTYGNQPNASSTLVVVAGFMGSALTWAFGLEVQTRTARQSETSHTAGVAAGAASGSNGHAEP